MSGMNERMTPYECEDAQAEAAATPIDLSGAEDEATAARLYADWLEGNEIACVLCEEQSEGRGSYWIMGLDGRAYLIHVTPGRAAMTYRRFGTLADADQAMLLLQDAIVGRCPACGEHRFGWTRDPREHTCDSCDRS
jgi:hypothetical protein